MLLRRIPLTLWIAVAAPLAAQSAPLKVAYQLDTLSNGLTLIVHEDHSAPVVSVNVWYHDGSGDEKVGRTGFAHLFEHLMFMGSEHAPYPAFDRQLEAAGADNNGSTTEDRTNYFEWGPANALPLMLWLEADRMGWLLPTMDSAKVDLQRDVVKNERRQSYENQPYGMVADVLPPTLYPAGHPYSWPVIGSMKDLSAASVEDVKQFFRTYYAPNNASLVVAGDVKAADVKALVEKYFAEIPRGPAITRPEPAAFALPRDTAVVLEDRVQLPRLDYVWHTVKGWSPDDAALEVAASIMAGSKSSRLTRKLVYDLQIASEVNAYQDGKRLDGDFTIEVMAKPGHPLPELQRVIDAEVARLAAEGPTERELGQAKNSYETQLLSNMERARSAANRMNYYFYAIGTPDGFQRDLERHRAVTAEDVQRVVKAFLTGPRVIVSVVPQGKPELAATGRVAP